jgi:hypothetical protein
MMSVNIHVLFKFNILSEERIQQFISNQQPSLVSFIGITAIIKDHLSCKPFKV